MCFYDLGPAMLLNEKTSGPLSVGEWERLHGDAGYLHDEWWFRAVARLAGLARAVAVARASHRQGQQASLQDRPDGPAPEGTPALRASTL